MRDYEYDVEDYEEYELPPESRRSLAAIADHLKRGYTDEKSVRSHLNFCENLSKEVRRTLRDEEGIGYRNDTLRHDFQRMQELIGKLNAELDRVDTDMGKMDRG